MLTVENLQFAYKRRHPLYTGLSLELKPGRIYGLLGQNGVGKSTLLYLMAGLLHPDGGRVSFHGADVRRRMPEQLADVFLVPEEFDLPKMKLSEFLRVYAPFYPRYEADCMRDCLESFGLAMEQDLAALSMGQKKKVYISFALASGASLLLMDEPTNGLDIPGKSVFRRILARYMDERRSVLISTHQAADVDKMLDALIILDHQGLLIDASVADVCRRLSFEEGVSEAEAQAADVLYKQPVLGGYAVVRPNPSGEEGGFNLELFFNALLNHSEKICKVLNDTKDVAPTDTGADAACGAASSGKITSGSDSHSLIR